MELTRLVFIMLVVVAICAAKKTKTKSCEYKGVTYKKGAKFNDDCNDCQCKKKGIVQCKMRTCPVQNSCQELKRANPDSGNGDYWFSNGNGELYKAYCQFESDHGYMFISKENTNVTINFDLIDHSTSEVLVKHLKSDDRQFDVTMEQISKNRPLSVQYNANHGYATPQNHKTMGPYIYLGFLDKDYATNRNKQGFKANGKSYEFNNCDANPNSYLAFFFNENRSMPTGYEKRCCYSPLMVDWVDLAIPATAYLPCEYFYQFEMHMGGCGGYVVNRHGKLQDTWGAAIGLRFDLSEE